MKAAELAVEQKGAQKQAHTEKGALPVPGDRKDCLTSRDAYSLLSMQQIELTHHLIHKQNFKLEGVMLGCHRLFCDNK